MIRSILLKSRLGLATLSALTLIAFSGNAQLKGDTYASAKSKKMGTVTLTYSFAPGFIYKDNSGKVQGICVDIMKAYAQHMQKTQGIRLNFKFESKNPNNFTGFLSDVKASKGGVFGLSNTTITQERKASYNFSPSYITNMAIMISHKSVPTLTKISDISTVFKGMTAVTVKNSTNEKYLKEIKAKYFPAMKITYQPSFDAVMDVVEKDPTKFTNQDLAYYFDAMKKRKPVKRHPGGDLGKEQFGIIMPKSNDWSPSLTKFFQGYIGSSAYKSVVTKHLGQSAVKFMDSL